MSAKINAFLAEVRNAPAFVVASANDPKWLEVFEAVERGFVTVDRLVDDDPAIIDIFDKILAVIGRSDLSLKQRLLEVEKLLIQIRNSIIITH